MAFKVAVADATKVKSYMRNFGEFYNNQLASATAVILSRTSTIAPQKLKEAGELIRSVSPNCTVITTPWEELTGKQMADAMEGAETIAAFLAAMQNDHHCCCGHDHGHEHHHHDHEDGHCCCGHDHDHEHHHHHDHEDGHCCCGHDHDHEHHHHHADEVFTSWGAETPRPYTVEAITAALESLADEEKFGIVLRAKGIVAAEDGKWIHFDYIPGTPDVRYGSAETTGRLCVIGSKLNEEAVAKLFCL